MRLKEVKEITMWVVWVGRNYDLIHSFLLGIFCSHVARERELVLFFYFSNLLPFICSACLLYIKKSTAVAFVIYIVYESI